ncbi:cytoplasmic protein [Halomonas sp. ND22Bw]|uniref:cupin domain-containing protein n=1 Tax=Halomonas sp. ND22Bw TaxID=2054178 RepID=UPI000D0AFCC3|nr:cytoplasmic protein [Halomonas sp. ND22Bw]
MLVLNETANNTALAAFGSVANLGAKVLEGDPQASGAALVGQEGAPQILGIFACTRGRFQVDHDFAEHATLVKGRVTLVDNVSGERRTFEPGEAWYIAKGENLEWIIESDEMIKHYLAIF